MPNHYTTMCICSPGHDFDVDEFNEKHTNTNLCAVVKPMPESIEQIASISYPDGSMEKDRRDEGIDWYDWANENWGTKWGTYNVKAFNLDGDGKPILIKFQSAWSPPSILNEIAAWLKRIGKFDNILFMGFDPYDDSTKLL